jgi:hypothetical protein
MANEQKYFARLIAALTWFASGRDGHEKEILCF